MRINVLLLTVSLLVSGAGLAFAENKPDKLTPDELTDILDFSPRTVYYGGCMIVEGQTVDGPVVVIAGSLDIQDGGILRGDAWIINGRLILTGKAIIEGKVRLVNSDEYSSHEAVITGEISSYRSESKLDDLLFEEEGIVRFIKYTDPKAVRTKLAFAGESSGRVGYLSFGIGIKRENDLHRDPYVKGKAWVSISPFKRSTNLIAFDGEYWIPVAGRRFDIVLHAFSRPWSNDNWMLSDRENSFIMLMTGDDFFDYRGSDGGEVGLRFKYSEDLTVKALVSYQNESSLAANPQQSVLYPTNKYRVNPEIDEGKRLAVSGTVEFDNRGEEVWRENSWLARIWFEKGIADGPGDFSYSAFEIDVRRYNYLPFDTRLDLRGRFFSSFTKLPRQLYRSLNGYGGVRGLSDRPFETDRGDRMSLFSVEARRPLPEVPVFKMIYSRWDLLLFSDIGLLANSVNAEAPFQFLDIPFAKWKKTAGIGFSGESFLPYIGFYIAQDLDADKLDPRYIIRFNRSF
ncbi:MAG: BamA/TamA family outer membrane protein [Candidatus Krumholzibacteriota bacterium]|nr:BamA/TamA family outer membrane protein [Candidatus Krumholzibacteriota bacterium]